MNSSRRMEQPIDLLLSKLFDARLDDAEQDRLAELLENDPQARLAYHEHVALHATLHWINSEPLMDATGEPVLAQVASPMTPGLAFLASPVPGTMSYASQGWPMAYLLATVIFAIGLTVGHLTPVSNSLRSVGSVPLADEHRFGSQPSVVGRITDALDCKPAANTRLAGVGDHLRIGQRIEIDAGLLEIAYDTGARVVLQGPVAYNVESPAGGYLSAGRLTARLEKRGEGRGERGESANQKSEIINHKSFSVRTPTAIITDLGTEFGVEVDRDGSTKSYVLVGSVRIEPADHGNGTKDRSVILHARDRAAVQKAADAAQADMTVEHNLAKPDHLVWPSELAGMARQQKLQRLARRKQCDEQIRCDPALVAYYDFQCRPDAPGELHAVGPAATALDGVIQRIPPQYFYALHSVAGNVLAGKPIEVSSWYGNDPTWAVLHLTDRSEASHVFSDGDSDQRMAIHGFNSPLAVVRLWRAEDRVAQQVTIKSSLADRASLNAADYETTLASQATLSFNDAGYADVAVKAPAGTQSIFLDFGDRTEYYPAGDWKLPAGVRTVEVQAFASPPEFVSPSAPPWWTTGRESGRTALQFDGINTRVTINVPNRLTHMTLAAWMTVDFIDDRSPSSGLLTSADPSKPGVPAEGIRWHIGRTGEILFHAGDCDVTTPSVLPWQTWNRGRWRHLAVVTDPTHQHAVCYLDGKPVHVQPLSDRFAATIGVAGVGGWRSANGQINCGFYGRMDELLILSRAMTDAEIAELYEMERP